MGTLQLPPKEWVHYSGVLLESWQGFSSWGSAINARGAARNECVGGWGLPRQQLRWLLLGALPRARWSLGGAVTARAAQLARLRLLTTCAATHLCSPSLSTQCSTRHPLMPARRRLLSQLRRRCSAAAAAPMAPPGRAESGRPAMAAAPGSPIAARLRAGGP